jgi:hypothetical protein
MRKIKLLWLVALLVNSLQAQDLPTIVPPSPNAYQMTKYGEVPVNEATGNISLSVPLFNYSAGSLSVPVSVNYTGNGVKTAQAATVVGVNWSLSAGGVITRSVRDKIDEMSPNKYFLEEYDLSNMPQGDWSTWQDISTFYGLMYSLGQQSDLHRGDDTQADIFNYNFPGYSGSFFFDENMTPHLIKYDKEVKIELTQDIGEQAKFKITTESGISYYFGGNNATEITRNRWGQGAAVSAWIPTSFFLYKIKNWNGDEIYFEYLSAGVLAFVSSPITSTMSRTEGYVSNGTGGNPPVYHNDFSFSITNSNIEYKNGNKYALDKIRNNRDNSFLSFFYASDFLSEPNNGNTMMKSLSNIVLNKTTNDVLSEVSFKYIQPLRSDGIPKLRFFLEEIEFKDENGLSNEANYKFEYDNLAALPLMDTNAVDHLNYYNGKNNNGASLIPLNIDNEIIPQDVLDKFITHYGAQYFADREADFNYAKIGSLTKVIYPTKGYTSFEYESGKNGFKKAYTTFNFNLDYLHDNNANNDIISQTSNFAATIDGTAHVDFNTSSSAWRTRGFVTVRLTVKDLTLSTEVISDLVVGSPHPDPNPPVLHTGSATFEVINGHSYQLIFEFTTSLGFANDPFDLLDPNTNLLATANIKIPIQGPPKDALGIRIKRIVSTTDSLATPQIKRYYYSNKEHLNDFQNHIVSPRYLRYDKYDRVKVITSVETNNPLFPNYFSEDYMKKDILVSNNLGAIYEDDSSKKLYPVVTVSYGGDNFENGGEELFFKVKSNAPPSTNYYGLTPYKDSYRFSFSNTTNYAWENGTLYSKNVFKKNGSNFELKSKTETHYKIDESKSYTIKNLMVEKNAAIEIRNFGSNWNPIENLKVGTYQTFSKWHAVDEVKTTVYFGSDSIQTTQKYFYDTGWAGIPTRIETTTSAGDNTMQKMYYPDQIISTSALPGGIISSASYYATQHLKANQEHRIATPIQTESYKNSTLLSRQRTNYKEENNLTLPKTIQVSKGAAPLKDVIMYHKYDNYGNPLEVSKKDGVHICYVWGYNHTKPVAKIVGVNYNQLPTAALNAVINFNYTTGTEANLITKLNALRAALPNAQVSTFTYKPLIGVSTMTDAKGQQANYYYDSFNRLQYVKDAQGHLLKENEYHFRLN